MEKYRSGNSSSSYPAVDPLRMEQVLTNLLSPPVAPQP
jgi:hypothetical protein